MIINKEDFEGWLASPVTEEVFKFLRAAAHEAKEEWCEKAWKAGLVDERVLVEHRARSEALLQVTELDFETLEEANAEDSEKRKQA